MSRGIFYIMVCSATLTLVVSSDFQVPATVPHPSKQCQSSRFKLKNACKVAELNCKHLFCAHKYTELGSWTKIDIGKAANGTPCTGTKVCHNGKCVPLPKGQEMPKVLGSENRFKPCLQLSR